MAPTPRAFAQVDVFTTEPGLGNPVAVVLDADGLTSEEMQRFANWTNLSETTFVLPPASSTADYRLRIFTGSSELPFAGHPTLGSAHALLDAGRLPDRDTWVQECLAGFVDVGQDADGAFSFSAPDPVIAPSPLTPEQLSRFTRGTVPADTVLVHVGPRWLTGRTDLASLDALQPDAGSVAAAVAAGLLDGINLYAVDDDKVVHVRSFFFAGDVAIEDPVCGSGNAAAAAHLIHTGRTGDVPPVYEARQGRHLRRDGRITVTPGNPIRVGGHAVTVVSGTVTI